uniref:(northern house mosquito) hypothetical protein n=1 Tax=Culex pipiens TaxID=7175 RepID=A0A8D8DX51_CULPI
MVVFYCLAFRFFFLLRVHYLFYTVKCLHFHQTGQHIAILSRSRQLDRLAHFKSIQLRHSSGFCNAHSRCCSSKTHLILDLTINRLYLIYLCLALVPSYYL